MNKYIFQFICCLFPLCILLLSSCSSKSKTTISLDQDSEQKLTPKFSSSYVQIDSMVRSIFEDSKGNYWFGRDHAGLSRYDGKTMTHFNSNDGLGDNQIRTIQEDQNGMMWFATASGLTSYDGEKFTIEVNDTELVNNLIVPEAWNSNSNDLWFNGEIEDGIYRYDGQNLSVLEFPELDLKHESFSITGTVTGISKGKNNRLWMANYGGVIGYDGTSFVYINDRKYDYHVRSIFEDSKGNLWIGNNGIGVLLYDGHSTINFSKKHGVSDQNGQSGGTFSPIGTLNHVFAIAEDRAGNIWFGDRDAGAWRYDGQSLQNYTLKDGLSNTFVRSIYQDKKGDLWFGLGDGTVCQFNGKSFVKMH